MQMSTFFFVSCFPNVYELVTPFGAMPEPFPAVPFVSAKLGKSHKDKIFNYVPSFCSSMKIRRASDEARAQARRRSRIYLCNLLNPPFFFASVLSPSFYSYAILIRNRNARYSSTFNYLSESHAKFHGRFISTIVAFVSGSENRCYLIGKRKLVAGRASDASMVRSSIRPALVH